MNRRLSATSALLALLLGACGRPPEATNLWEASVIRKAKERGRLVVALEPEFQPFEYLDERGEIVGFDVDLARELGRDLGVPVEFRKVAWETISAELASGNADLIISGRTTTPERALSESYSDPYFETITCLLVSKKKAPELRGIQDLNQPGRVVAVKLGTTGETAARRRCPRAEIVTFPAENAAALEVAQGKADAFLYDLAAVRKHAAEYADLTFVIEDPVSVEPYAIACRKGDPETVAWLNLCLSLMRRDGRLKELYARHGLEAPGAGR
jgi:polar amino acid transport system substrate-binding protein